VFKLTGIILCALVFLAGCATAPNGPEEVISAPPASAGAPALNWPPPGAEKSVVAPMTKSNVVAAPRTNPPAPAPKPAPVLTWTSLKRWAVEHRLAPPRLLSNAPVTTYAIRSANGEMTLTIGSHGVIWNGVEVELGFEPQIVDGEIYVHELDLRKNLEPLLCEPPLAFGPNRVIVIDPGHGGINTGTHSVLDGRPEKEFTLDWAMRLAPLLETNGWTVFLTRTNDTEVMLSGRVALATAHHADVFISLHFNSAAPNKTQGGLETYCLTPAGMPSTLTRGYADMWSDSFPNNQCDAQNLELAVRLQASLLHAMGEQDRSVRRARFMGVLQGQHCPAILIEAGYLSNPEEAKLIESPEYRQKLAEAVAAALK
jgi:N-acetylmuramoyl-L-alanine amidase